MSQPQLLNTATAVKTIRLAAHRRVRADGLSENHWSIYLLLEPGSTANLSVRMNMVAEHGNEAGELKYTAHAYTQSNSVIEYWDIDLASGVTVQMIQTLVQRLGRDRYLFSGGGSGCRFWW